MTVRRFPDWQTRLFDYLAAAEARAFSWSRFNCCTFAAGGIQAMTGVDPAAGFQWPARRSRAALISAVRAYAGGGVGDLARRVTGDLGLAAVPVAFAGRGDVVHFNASGLEAIGLVDLDGRRVAFVAEGCGLVRIPVHKIPLGASAWRV